MNDDDVAFCNLLESGMEVDSSQDKDKKINDKGRLPSNTSPLHLIAL